MKFVTVGVLFEGLQQRNNSVEPSTYTRGLESKKEDKNGR